MTVSTITQDSGVLQKKKKPISVNLKAKACFKSQLTFSSRAFMLCFVGASTEMVQSASD